MRVDNVLVTSILVMYMYFMPEIISFCVICTLLFAVAA